MTGSDDDRKGVGAGSEPVLRPPDTEDEVHSSAELDFDQLTTSALDFPVLKITQPSTPPSTDEATEDQTLNDEQDRPSVMEEAPSLFEPATGSATPMERVTFSNLEALVPETPPKPAIEASAPAAAPVQRQTTIHDVRPPSLAKFFIGAGILVALGLIVLFGIRIDWDMALLQDDPSVAMYVALGVQEKPKGIATSPTPVEPAKTDNLRGELRTIDIKLERVSQGAEKGALVIRGRLQNNTNRIQTMVMLRGSLLSSDGLALESRKQRCCQLEDTATRPQAEPKGTSLKPGDVKYFSILFSRKHSRTKKIRPRVEILFSEAERLP